MDRHIGKTVRLNRDVMIQCEDNELVKLDRFKKLTIINYTEEYWHVKLDSDPNFRNGVFLWIPKLACSGLMKQPNTIPVHGGLIVGSRQRKYDNPLALSLYTHGFRNTDTIADVKVSWRGSRKIEVPQKYWIRIGEQDGDCYITGPKLTEWLTEYYNGGRPKAITVEFVRKYGVSRPETCNQKSDWFVEITEGNDND